MGEARKSGPHTSFDNESDDAWSEFGDLSQLESEQPDGWKLPPTEMEAAVGEIESTAAEAGVRADKTAVGKWTDLHANDTFVPVKTKRITKAPEIDGAKPGWVFKTGERGLGYYRDNGGLRTHLSLDLALRPMRSLPVATISLDDLVISDSEGTTREHPASARPVCTDSGATRELRTSGFPNIGQPIQTANNLPLFFRK